MTASLPGSYEDLVKNYRSNTPMVDIFESKKAKVEKWTHRKKNGGDVWVKLIENRGRWETCRSALKELNRFLIPWCEFEHESKLYCVMEGGAQTVYSIFQATDQILSEFLAEALSFGLRFLCACVRASVMYVDIKPLNMVCSAVYGFRMIDLDSFLFIDDITVEALEDPSIVPATIYGINYKFYKYSTLFDHALFHLLYTFVKLYVGEDDVFKGVECPTIFKPGGDAGSPVAFGRMIVCQNDAYDEHHPFHEAIKRGNFLQTDFTELIVKIYKDNMAQAKAATDIIKQGQIPNLKTVRNVCKLTSEKDTRHLCS